MVAVGLSGCRLVNNITLVRLNVKGSEAVHFTLATSIGHLNQFTDFFSADVFFRGAILSGHIVNLLCDASILQHAGGLHKDWDSLRYYSAITVLRQLIWEKFV